MTRSPNYPSHSLSEAVAFVEQVYNKEKKTQVSREDVAIALGNSSLSGSARSKIASMKKYELLDGDEAKGVRVSDLAVHILYPSSEAEALGAKRQAALSPSLFKHLYDEKREGSDESIRNYLVNKMDFTPDGAKQAINSFRDTIAFAQLPSTEDNASNTPEKAQAHSILGDSKSASSVDSFMLSESFRNFGVAPSVTHVDAVSAWTWTLSMPRSVQADLRIVGKVTKSDITRLKRHIQALEESFDDEEAEK